MPIFYKLVSDRCAPKEEILNNILYFNDINELRTKNIKKVFKSSQYNLNITNIDFLKGISASLPAGEIEESCGDHFFPIPAGGTGRFDLVVANPPYAKLLKNGKRASKNHNMIKLFIQKALDLLKKEGYILFLVPDN